MLPSEIDKKACITPLQSTHAHFHQYFPTLLGLSSFKRNLNCLGDIKLPTSFEGVGTLLKIACLIDRSHFASLLPVSTVLPQICPEATCFHNILEHTTVIAFCPSTIRCLVLGGRGRAPLPHCTMH